MGLLDDAIREHLDLKRRRGADPTEVDQLERDALGPVRRSTQVSDEPLPEEEPFEHEGSETALYDDEADEVYAESAELVTEPAGTEESDERFPEDESGRGWSHDSAEAWDVEQPAARAETWDTEPPPAPDDPAAPAAEAPAPAPPAGRPPPPAPAEPVEERSEHPGEETIEYDVEREELERGDREEDVLEETPEFLQDTPDHDRLWFEQRPPKDFDFDK
jgi:hypothetical protein